MEVTGNSESPSYQLTHRCADAVMAGDGFWQEAQKSQNSEFRKWGFPFFCFDETGKMYVVLRLGTCKDCRVTSRGIAEYSFTWPANWQQIIEEIIFLYQFPTQRVYEDEEVLQKDLFEWEEKQSGACRREEPEMVM